MAGTSDVSGEVAGSSRDRKDKIKGQVRPARNLGSAPRPRQSSPAPASPSLSTEDIKIGRGNVAVLGSPV